jgi:hypothetical protein
MLIVVNEKKLSHRSVLRIGKVAPNDGTAPVNPAVKPIIVSGHLFAFFSRASNQELPVLSERGGRIPGAVVRDVQIQHRSVLQIKPVVHVFDVPVKVPSDNAGVRHGPVDFHLSTLADTVAARSKFVPQCGAKFVHRSVLQKGPSIRQGGLVVRAQIIFDLLKSPA